MKKIEKVVDNRKDTWYHIRVVTERKLNNKKINKKVVDKHLNL